MGDEVSPLSFITPNCDVNAALDLAESIAVHFELSGTSTNVIAGPQTITCTYSGSADAVGWARTTARADIFDPSLLASDEFLSSFLCCTGPNSWTVALGQGPEILGQFKEEDFGTIDCTCTGTPCTDYPTSNTYDLLWHIEINQSLTFDPSDPKYYIFVSASMTVESFEGNTADFAAADMVGVHTITIDNTPGSGDITLEVTVTIA